MLVLRRLLGYYRPYWLAVVMATLLSIVVSSMDALLAIIIKPIFDEILFGKNVDFLKLMPLIIISLVFVKSLLSYVANYQMNLVGLKAIQNIREALFQHYTRLSLGFFDSRPMGDLISRACLDVGTLSETMPNVVQVFRQTLTLMALLLVVFYRDWQLTLIGLAIVPVTTIPIYIIGKIMRRLNHRALRTVEKLSGITHEVFSGIHVVRSFTGEEKERIRFEEQNENFTRVNLKSTMITLWSNPTTELLSSIGISLVFIIGGLRVVRGDITPGEFFSFVAAMMLMYRPIRKFNVLNRSFQILLAGADRVFEMFDQELDVTEKPDASDIPELSKEIEFKDIRMTYGADEVIKGISFKIHKGEVVALVGPSGSGKTTLANLIPRFYDVSSGAVTIDGVDVRDATLKSLRSQIGVVTQETFLFHETIRDNIAYGLEGDVSMEDIDRVAEDSSAKEFISRMAKGYDTLVGERGGKLSGGERQRVAIARALLKNAPILILDEATSSLDSENERLVQKALYRLMENRTVLVIAHRLSTVRRADRILVIEDGLIVEQGKHEELMEAGGLYKRLYEMQYFDAEESAA